MLRAIRRLPDKTIRRLAGDPVVKEGRTLDPMVQILRREAKKQAKPETLPPAEARLAAEQGFALLDGPPRKVEQCIERLAPGPVGDIPVVVYTPKDVPSKTPVLLYFHQGGCVIGSPRICHRWCTVLADTAKCLVVSVDYRLAPENKFPAAVDDALAVYRWLGESAPLIGGDSSRIAVGGDSAGGNLSAVICHTMRKEGLPQPLFQLLIYPWVSAAMDHHSYEVFGDCFPLSRDMMEWFGSSYLKSESERWDTRVSPLLEDEFSGLAPAHVVTAGFDPLVDEGNEYARKLEAAGVPVTHTCYESLCHGFTGMGGALASAESALDEIAVRTAELCHPH